MEWKREDKLTMSFLSRLVLLELGFGWKWENKHLKVVKKLRDIFASTFPFTPFLQFFSLKGEVKETFEVKIPHNF